MHHEKRHTRYQTLSDYFTKVPHTSMYGISIKAGQCFKEVGWKNFVHATSQSVPTHSPNETELRQVRDSPVASPGRSSVLHQWGLFDPAEFNSQSVGWNQVIGHGSKTGLSTEGDHRNGCEQENQVKVLVWKVNSLSKKVTFSIFEVNPQITTIWIRSSDTMKNCWASWPWVSMHQYVVAHNDWRVDKVLQVHHQNQTPTASEVSASTFHLQRWVRGKQMSLKRLNTYQSSSQRKTVNTFRRAFAQF